MDCVLRLIESKFEIRCGREITLARLLAWNRVSEGTTGLSFMECSSTNGRPRAMPQNLQLQSWNMPKFSRLEPTHQRDPSNMSVIICFAIMGCHKILFQVNVFVPVWGVVSFIKSSGWVSLGFITSIKLYGIVSEILATENQRPKTEGAWRLRANSGLQSVIY